MDEVSLNMAPGRYCFDRFLLDVADRRLLADGEAVELNSRYLDALALLVRERGKLVPKERFLDEVWRGVPVTDEALTQCIKTLRRQLGDDAARPRFIETVPKHGYRFIAAVEPGGGRPAVRPPEFDWRRLRLLGLAGTVGGGLAGVIGGLIYGFAATASPGVGGISMLLVLLSITALVGLVGAAGVAFGIASADFAPTRAWHWSMLGGAAGGLVVGALVKLLGIDAFNLLFGRAPDGITGAAEGAILGGAIGLGAWLAAGRSVRRSMAIAGLAGGAGGAIVPLLGGRLMGGSLDSLVRQFPGSRLRLDVVGALLGESGFGPTTQLVTGALEGLLFGACVVGAMTFARRAGMVSPPSPYGG
ncbi:MAG: winged helix-turn-helix domain-containing protein [Pseudomonadota bacterium]|nr:winged helix-turn-helix domain-containing protein [Pseudomonadota bacterium]